MSTIKAKVAIVKLGNLEFEGLLLEDGRFAVAHRQVASLFQILPNSVYKWLKALLGNDSSYFSVKTDREQVENKRVRSSENAISILDFEIVIVELTAKGNPIAADMNRALVGVALVQLFSDTFGVKFEQDDRAAYLKTRMTGKYTRRELTDSIKAWYDRPDTQTTCPLGTIIAQCTNQLYQAMWGVTAAEIRSHFNLTKDSQLTRDFLSERALNTLKLREDYVIEFIDYEGAIPHKNAVQMANIIRCRVHFTD